MSDYSQDALKNLKHEHDFFVGIDSDGCAFDTMELKHKECFIPNIVKHWKMQAISKYTREAAEFVNLYSKWRGINRFPALVMVFDLLKERPEVLKRNVKIPDDKSLRDFIDSGKYLIENNFTSSDHLYAMGGSAGGLLMGAILNMNPELFNGVVAAVPFVDVITTMLDETIPLTTSEYDEWGDPNKKDYYDYMLSYSPYDNVEKKSYTNILVTTGLHDSQVQYYEPAKWVAKLREYKTGNNILFLHTNMEAGHGGASGRFNAL